MPQPLVRDPADIRLAMLGMIPGNGHPYSWSAIVNGTFDADAIRKGGYPGIVDYLEPQPREALGIAGARVTHICCDDRADADRVARAAGIPHVVDRPEEVIGDVDAVIVATDIGGEHVARARPFVEAGLPVFIDKPLVDDAASLRQFHAWRRSGAAILSTSGLRYAREFASLREELPSVGEARVITGTMVKSWERYGIHAIESVYGLLRPGGWTSVTHTGDTRHAIIHARHADGAEVVLAVVEDLYGSANCVEVYGTNGRASARMTDTFTAFKRQLEAFIAYLRTGAPPFPWEQTVEQMKLLIAAIRSRDEDGRRVWLDEVGIEGMGGDREALQGSGYRVEERQV